MNRYVPVSDVWSFGIILFYMMFLQFPYSAPDPMTLGVRIATNKQNPPPIDKLELYSAKLHKILSHTLERVFFFY
jgi:serine/threonine protein kinase